MMIFKERALRESLVRVADGRTQYPAEIPFRYPNKEQFS